MYKKNHYNRFFFSGENPWIRIMFVCFLWLVWSSPAYSSAWVWCVEEGGEVYLEQPHDHFTPSSKEVSAAEGLSTHSNSCFDLPLLTSGFLNKSRSSLVYLDVPVISLVPFRQINLWKPYVTSPLLSTSQLPDFLSLVALRTVVLLN